VRAMIGMIQVGILLIVASGFFGGSTEYRGHSEMVASADTLSVLVFSKTTGWRHDSIEAGVSAIRDHAPRYGMRIQHSEDADLFADDSLDQFDVVVFLNTTGPILTDPQRSAFERFIRNGGGFVGVHSATDTEYDWEWYGGLVGARFDNHPHIQEARIFVDDPDHSSTRHLGHEWTRTDEWYNFRAAPTEVSILLRLDPSSFEGGTMGDHHPIAWHHEYDGGRAWYTAGGHTIESYSEPDFMRHVMEGIRWAGGRATE
jgi:type 1 glutamine amidotransferase